MDIMATVQWFQAHGKDVVNVITGVIAVASIIVRWTPTIKDNEALEKVVKFIGKYLALNRTVDDDAIRAGKTG